jgi:hypothetical protein
MSNGPGGLTEYQELFERYPRCQGGFVGMDRPRYPGADRVAPAATRIGLFVTYRWSAADGALRLTPEVSPSGGIFTVRECCRRRSRRNSSVLAGMARQGIWQWSSASRRVLASPLSGGVAAITGTGGAPGRSCLAGRWLTSRPGSS